VNSSQQGITLDLEWDSQLSLGQLFPFRVQRGGNNEPVSAEEIAHPTISKRYNWKGWEEGERGLGQPGELPGIRHFVVRIPLLYEKLAGSSLLVTIPFPRSRS